jgi:hypothetical protein
MLHALAKIIYKIASSEDYPDRAVEPWKGVARFCQALEQLLLLSGHFWGFLSWPHFSLASGTSANFTAQIWEKGQCRFEDLWPVL